MQIECTHRTEAPGPPPWESFPTGGLWSKRLAKEMESVEAPASRRFLASCVLWGVAAGSTALKVGGSPVGAAVIVAVMTAVILLLGRLWLLCEGDVYVSVTGAMLTPLVLPITLPWWAVRSHLQGSKHRRRAASLPRLPGCEPQIDWCSAAEDTDYYRRGLARAAEDFRRISGTPAECYHRAAVPLPEHGGLPQSAEEYEQALDQLFVIDTWAPGDDAQGGPIGAGARAAQPWEMPAKGMCCVCGAVLRLRVPVADELFRVLTARNDSTTGGEGRLSLPERTGGPEKDT